jgi:hypothetical protein
MPLHLLAILATIFVASSASAQSPAMIEEGRRLFFEETFDGNGRTCGTCHPATNNFTIDPAFVRTLPPSDPLFIVRSTKELRDIEIKQFLRDGVILENLDSFANPGVMRGVPHTLALRPSTRNNLTGWSGDGSPGALREFATGAVTQHFPRTLNRVPGVDFRLPDSDELEAMLAFQLSLGRQADPVLAELEFDDPVVQEGLDLFTGAARARDGSLRSCSGCHTNGSTNDQQRATGTELLPTGPVCEQGFKVPGDGGQGQTPVTTVVRKQLCGKGPDSPTVFRGNRTFNVPPAIEAADTPPFFHNNAVATLEDAIRFYTSDIFNASSSGAGRAFVLDTDEINAIGAFLRALNAMENIESANALGNRAANPNELAPVNFLMDWWVAETEDAIDVLTKGPIKLYPDAVMALREAREFERQARLQSPPNVDLMRDAIAAQEYARDAILPEKE